MTIGKEARAEEPKRGKIPANRVWLPLQIILLMFIRSGISVIISLGVWGFFVVAKWSYLTQLEASSVYTSVWVQHREPKCAKSNWTIEVTGSFPVTPGDEAHSHQSCVLTSQLIKEVGTLAAHGLLEMVFPQHFKGNLFYAKATSKVRGVRGRRMRQQGQRAGRPNHIRCLPSQSLSNTHSFTCSVFILKGKASITANFYLECAAFC